MAQSPIQSKKQWNKKKQKKGEGIGVCVDVCVCGKGGGRQYRGVVIK